MKSPIGPNDPPRATANAPTHWPALPELVMQFLHARFKLSPGEFGIEGHKLAGETRGTHSRKAGVRPARRRPHAHGTGRPLPACQPPGVRPSFVQIVDDEGVAVPRGAREVRMVGGKVVMGMRNFRRIEGGPKPQSRQETERAEGRQRE